MPNHPLGTLAAVRGLLGRAPNAGGTHRPEQIERFSAKKRRRTEPTMREGAGERASEADAEPVYLAEHYLPGVDARRVDAHVSRLAEAAEGARRNGLEVLFLGSAGLPGDESLLSLFSAPSADDVAHTIELAEVSVDRIVPVLWRTGGSAIDERDPR